MLCIIREHMQMFAYVQFACVRERGCVCDSDFCSQTNYENQKNPKKTQKEKKIQTNVTYHTRTYANFRIRPPNWTYANIRNCGSNSISLGQDVRLQALSALCISTMSKGFTNVTFISFVKLGLILSHTHFYLCEHNR